MFWKSIGQERSKQYLYKIVNEGAVPSSMVFYGALGYGALPLVIDFIKYLYCDGKDENGACETCFSCRQVSEGIHTDVHFYFPLFTVAKQKTRSDYMKDWRAFLLENTYAQTEDWLMHIGGKKGVIGVEQATHISQQNHLQPSQEKYKVFLIWGAEYMNVETSNKLLKTLEEPNPKSIYILLVEDQNKLLPTVSSRLFPIQMQAIPDRSMYHFLVDKYVDKPLENLEYNVQYADGNLAKILNIYSSENKNLTEFREWMRICIKPDVHKLSKWLDAFLKNNGLLAQIHFLERALEYIRQSIRLYYLGESAISLVGEEKIFICKFSPCVDNKNAEYIVKNINRAIMELDRNVNPKMVFYDMSFALFKMYHKRKVSR